LRLTPPLPAHREPFSFLRFIQIHKSLSFYEQTPRLKRIQKPPLGNTIFFLILHALFLPSPKNFQRCLGGALQALRERVFQAFSSRPARSSRPRSLIPPGPSGGAKTGAPGNGNGICRTACDPRHGPRADAPPGQPRGLKSDHSVDSTHPPGLFSPPSRHPGGLGGFPYAASTAYDSTITVQSIFRRGATLFGGLT